MKIYGNKFIIKNIKIYKYTNIISSKYMKYTKYKLLYTCIEVCYIILKILVIEHKSSIFLYFFYNS